MHPAHVASSRPRAVGRPSTKCAARIPVGKRAGRSEGRSSRARRRSSVESIPTAAPVPSTRPTGAARRAPFARLRLRLSTTSSRTPRAASRRRVHTHRTRTDRGGIRPPPPSHRGSAPRRRRTIAAAQAPRPATSASGASSLRSGCYLVSPRVFGRPSRARLGVSSWVPRGGEVEHAEPRPPSRFTRVRSFRAATGGRTLVL